MKERNENEQVAEELKIQLQEEMVLAREANPEATQEQLYISIIKKFAPNNAATLNTFCSSYERIWCAFFEAGKYLGVEFDEPTYELFRRFCLHCPILMWDDEAVYVLRNPKQIQWAENRLHCEDGPSVILSEDFKLWTINGVAVDEQIVMRPETQTVEQIRSEENEEVKRIRIERYGWDKYLSEIDAKVLDTRKNEIEQTTESLMSYEGGKVLVCACPSTGKVFALEVDPEVGSCVEAQKWLHSGSTIDDIIQETRVIGRT